MAGIFDWREHERQHARERYDLKPWRDLVDALAEPPEEGQTLEEHCLDKFETFLAALPNTNKQHQKPCVFISHQRADTRKGKRIACLADHHSVDYWLDVHDPTLRLANKLPNGDPRKSVLIAAIIEIALLRCTHVIAVHTARSLRSRWIPYELGRAKARQIRSTQAAGWFDTGQDEKTCGDYVQLAVMTRSEAEVIRWLKRTPGSSTPASPVASPCRAVGHSNVSRLN